MQQNRAWPLNFLIVLYLRNPRDPRASQAGRLGVQTRLHAFENEALHIRITLNSNTVTRSSFALGPPPR